MEPNKSQNTADEDNLLDEFDISSFSSATATDKKDEKIRKLEAELQQIKEANFDQFGGLSMMQMAWQFGEKFGKMEKEMDGLKAQMGKMKEEFEELKKGFGKLSEEFGKIVEFETKMRELLEQKADKEMVGDLTGRIDGMAIQMKNNKWNGADCGRKWAISEGGLVVKHNGPRGASCIRAISPIPPFNLNSGKPSIAGYYEVQIIAREKALLDGFGFCTQQFPLEGKCLGDEQNSIGIYYKAGMQIDGEFKFNDDKAIKYFQVGDVIGVGIIHFPANSPMKCFSTCNGQLLGTIELPHHFVTLQLFPALTSVHAGNSFRANFGQETWRFDASELLK